MTRRLFEPDRFYSASDVWSILESEGISKKILSIELASIQYNLEEFVIFQTHIVQVYELYSKNVQIYGGSQKLIM